MMQKIVVGMLALTVIGAVAVGAYDSANNSSAADEARVLADAPANVESAPIVPVAAPEQAAQIVPTATPQVAEAAPAPGTGTGPVQQQQQQALDMVGDPWSSTGTITAIETNGVTLARKDSGQIFVELGPSYFWADAALAVGDTITVYGFSNGEQYHAGTVILSDGSTLALRSETGTPLWSGGAASGGAGQTQTGATNRNGQAEPQVAPDAWVTLEGTVVSVDLSTLLFETVDGEQLALQLGQQAFMQQQGITFAPGEAVRVLGFWQGTTFRAGEITRLATGQRLMLLDPNGRPLWGGPGRNGQGNASSAQSQGQAQGQAAQTAQGGRGYRGGR